MSNIEKLKQWFEAEQKKGLEDIKFYPSGHAFSSVESFSASVLHTIQSIEQGRYTQIKEL